MSELEVALAGKNVSDYTRQALATALSSPVYSDVADMWRKYLEGLGLTGSVGDMFKKFYTLNNVPLWAQNPIYAGLYLSTPFNGIFMDTISGDTFTARMSYTSDPTLTVNDNTVSFSSASAVAIDLNVKEDDGTPMWHCFDYCEVYATFTVTSFPAVDVTGFLVGWERSDGASNYFAGEVKAHPGSSTQLYRRLHLNASPRVNGASGYVFAPGVNGTLLIKREGLLLSCVITFDNGISSETLTKTMEYPATSDELPRLLSVPFIRFVQGTSTITGMKVSASYPNSKFAFIGDSLTQGRFATAYADAFPQLIRGDYPGNVIVCGAPSATTADWLNGTRSVIRMKPKYAFVALGTNDIGAARPDAAIKADFTTINTRLTSAGIIPVYITLPPVNNANTPTLNTWLKSQGWRYIDIYPALEGTVNQLNAAYNSGDGVHWNTAGNLVVANLVRTYITTQGW
jgi:lysophospholipase L1-like esterase